MNFSIELRDVRPVKELQLSIDLDRNAPLCIVGRNGAGKTTLAKAIMNFALADTFQRTTSTGALRENSYVKYQIDGISFEFSYDPVIGSLSTHLPVPEELRSLIAVELPIPHGYRFNSFPALSQADDEIRRAIILNHDSRPDALIHFLNNIYGDERFKNLREVEFSRGRCCFFIDEEERYVREDYFSSGEFFLVNLYRRLQLGLRLIFIDEIDISLDAAAQARLVGELRRLCKDLSVNVVFTSHSLALMRTLQDGELLYLEAVGNRSTLETRSYSYVKSLMFGFQGWDRYILVEDFAAKLVIQYLIDTYCTPTFHTYFIIEVGGAAQVVSLLQRNRENSFLGSPGAVIAILDGDQAGSGYVDIDSTYSMPLYTLEGAFQDAYEKPDFTPRLPEKTYNGLPQGQGRSKALFKAYRRARLQSDSEIVAAACKADNAAMQVFARDVILPFLSARQGQQDTVAP